MRPGDRRPLSSFGNPIAVSVTHPGGVGSAASSAAAVTPSFVAAASRSNGGRPRALEFRAGCQLRVPRVDASFDRYLVSLSSND